MKKLITILSSLALVACLIGVAGATSITFAVPEPDSMVLLGSSLLIIAIYYKRRMNKEAC